MVLFDRNSGRIGSRLPTSMFFVRNNPHPQRVKHIEGLNGAWVCNVNDDPPRKRSKRPKSFSYNKNNLPVNETKRRTERLVPPTDFWHAHGIVHDTDTWRQELASLASASGIGSEKSDRKQSSKFPATTDQEHASRSGAHYSTSTGRFNEGTAKSRGRTSTKRGTGQQSDTLFNVPEDEREMWVREKNNSQEEAEESLSNESK